MMTVGATTFAADQEDPDLVGKGVDGSASGAAAAEPAVAVEIDALVATMVLDMEASNIGEVRLVDTVGTLLPSSIDVNGATTRTHGSLVASSGLSE